MSPIDASVFICWAFFLGQHPDKWLTNFLITTNCTLIHFFIATCNCSHFWIKQGLNPGQLGLGATRQPQHVMQKFSLGVGGAKHQWPAQTAGRLSTWKIGSQVVHKLLPFTLNSACMGPALFWRWQMDYWLSHLHSWFCSGNSWSFYFKVFKLFCSQENWLKLTEYSLKNIFNYFESKVFQQKWYLDRFKY